MGALYYAIPGNVFDENVQNVHEVVNGEEWDVVKLTTILHEDIVLHITNTIAAPRVDKGFDRSWWLLTNKDGASRGNPGRSSYGFYLRNAEGNIIYAQAEEMGITTNIDAEVMAILEALRYCRSRGMDNIIIQIDSEKVYKILEEGWKSPWGITIWIEEIKDFRNNMNVSYSNNLREGNKLVDALANQALDHGPVHCNDF
ncbi:uncharacterized protein LOC132048839 [Lycium ferocissimum]|uniref:uncharacterized protein LOC132048839 n=1 Tax=Lycium ferocissimum TaxID=112874 RepID=UPI00281660DC|nr:uncharacterized protein LOC132048839 [Lycium ferocissimum]